MLTPYCTICIIRLRTVLCEQYGFNTDERGGAANKDMVDFEKIKMDGSGPIYMQLIAFVKQGLASGEVKFGDAMPSRRVLSALLGINPNTVQKAYACSRLGVENAVYSPEGWEKQYDRHKADSLSAGTEYKAFFRFSQREEQGRIDGIETEKQKRNTVCRQRTPADLDHLYIAFRELGDDGRGTERHSQPEDRAEDG